MEPGEHLVSESSGSREQVQWSRYLSVSEDECVLKPNLDLQDVVGSADRVQKCFRGSTDTTDRLVCCSVVAAVTQDAVSSSAEVFACSNEVLFSERSRRVSGGVTQDGVHGDIADQRSEAVIGVHVAEIEAKVQL